MRIGDEDFAGHLVFVATAASANATEVGLGGVRSAMARAAELLQLDPGARLDVHPDAGAAPVRAHRTGTTSRPPSRRRTRRYAERQRHPVAS